MAIQVVDGFDVTTNDALFEWSTGAQVSILATGGRISGGRMAGQTAGVNSNARFALPLPTPVSKVGVCVGFMGSSGINGLGGTEPYNVLRFIDTGGNYHVGLRWNADGGPLTLYVGGNSSTAGTLVATGSAVLNLAEWTHVECWVEIADSGGRVVVYVDGNPTPDIDYTGDTRNGGNGVVGHVAGGHSTGGSGTVTVNTYWDDLVVYDDTGGVNDTHPLGDLRVLTLMPNGNGTTSDGVGSDGNSTDNYLLVDETTLDSDTTYVDFDAIGEKDTYAMAAAGVTGAVLGVQNRAAVRKTDAGTRAGKPVLRLSGTEVDGTEVFLNLSYRYIWQMHNTKPGGGSWSISDVDATEAGVKMTA